MRKLLLTFIIFLISISASNSQNLKSVIMDDSLSMIEKIYDSTNVLRVVKLIDKISMDSTLEFYRPDGRLFSKTITNKIIKERRTIKYYPNGRIKEDLILKMLSDFKDSNNFKVIREWTIYHDNGKILADMIYENGIEKKAIFYNLNGEISSKEEFNKIYK